jgi:hypothetical protein
MPSVSWDSSLGYSTMLPADLMPQAHPTISSFGDDEVKNGIQTPHVAPSSKKGHICHKPIAINELRRRLTPKKTGGVTVYGYRHYTPKTGQFLGRDPIGDVAFRFVQAKIQETSIVTNQLRKILESDENRTFDDNIDVCAVILSSIEMSLYRFSGNRPVSLLDILGLLEYSVLAGNYPTPDTYPTDVGNSGSIWKYIGGYVQINAEGGSWGALPNSCAVRMSHALNASGIIVAHDGNKTVSGKKPPKWWYYYRVADIKGFISGKFGQAKTFTKEEFKKNCKKGIVVLNIPWADATGHADLWDGSNMIDGHNDYIDLATSIEFWELEEDMK